MLRSQSMILFSRSLLLRSVEKRPMRLRLESETNDTPNAIGCDIHIYKNIPTVYFQKISCIQR